MKLGLLEIVAGIKWIAAGVVFLVTFLVLLALYGPKKSETFVIKRKNPFKTMNLRIVAYVLLAAATITYFVWKISSGVTASLIFAAIIGVSPLILSNAAKRDEQETMFQEVIYYCQTMGMLLKQKTGDHRDAFKALNTVYNDLETSLRDDVIGLLEAMEEGEEKCLAAMRVMESNYPFSCIKNLNVIIRHIQYMKDDVEDSLISTYQDDVTQLEQDVRRNKEKRKSLRLAYILLTAGSLAAYYFFVNSLKESFADIFSGELWKIMNCVYLFATLVAFFFVDRFFSLNTTKE